MFLEIFHAFGIGYASAAALVLVSLLARERG